mgnify:CR=1 FL=1
MFGLYKFYRHGYTLAEMLVVLAIVSMVMLAMPPVTKKVFKVDATAKKHGRVECYYNSEGKLLQYTATELGPSRPEEVENTKATYCSFIPPSNATYIMIHAVGGGGAGKDVDSDYDFARNKSTANARSTISYSTPGLWPEWFRYLLQHRPSELKLDYSNAFELQKTYTRQKLPFGISGQAGETVSLFFPQLSSTTEIRMYPGKGATVGTNSDGEDTKVEFVYNYNDPSSSETKEVIKAKGGVSGKDTYNFSTELYGGRATDFGIGSLQAVTIKSSKFEDLLEDANSSALKTMINRTENCVGGNSTCWSGLNAGYGGNGGYYYLDNGSNGDLLAGDFVYQVNNYVERYDGGYLNSSGEFTQNSTPDNPKYKSSNYGQYAFYRNRKTRTNHWYIVTKFIDKKFYNRNSLNGKCSLVDNPVGETYLQGTCFQHQAASRSNYYYCTVPYLKNSDDIAMVNYQYPELFAVYDTTWASRALTFQVDPETGNVVKTMCQYDSDTCYNPHYRMDYAGEGESGDSWGGVKYKRCESANNYFNKNDCTFDRNTLITQCKLKIKATQGRHHCVGDDKNTNYKNSDERITCQNNKCGALNGGNGAVIIVW